MLDKINAGGISFMYHSVEFEVESLELHQYMLHLGIVLEYKGHSQVY